MQQAWSGHAAAGGHAQQHGWAGQAPGRPGGQFADELEVVGAVVQDPQTHSFLAKFAVLMLFFFGGVPFGRAVAGLLLPPGYVQGDVFGLLTFVTFPLCVFIGAKAWSLIAGIVETVRSFSKSGRRKPPAGAWVFVPISAAIATTSGFLLGLHADGAHAITVAWQLGLVGAAYGGALWFLARLGAIPRD